MQAAVNMGGWSALSIIPGSGAAQPSPGVSKKLRLQKVLVGELISFSKFWHYNFLPVNFIG